MYLKIKILILSIAFHAVLFAQVDVDRVASFFGEGYSIAELENLLENMPLKQHEKWMGKRGYEFREEVPGKNLLVYKKSEVVTLYIFYSKDHITEVRVSSSPQKFYQAVDTFSKSASFRLVEYYLQKQETKKIEGYKYWRNNGFIYYSSAEKYINGLFRDYPADMDKSLPKSYLPEMVFVKGGLAKMGSDNPSDPEDIRPSYEISVPDFAIGKFEVTVKQYLYFCKVTNREFPKIDSKWSGESMPITNITWYDAVDYCEWLSYITGKRYRLPTEVESEFAAKGGNKSKQFKYAGSDFIEKIGWLKQKGQTDIRRVGSAYPNELDIYDMSANVFEWCSDWHNFGWNLEMQKSTLENRKMGGPDKGLYKIIRCGGNEDPLKSRVISKMKVLPNMKYADLGFRVVMNPS